jgi:glycerol-3-phosphate dehydrogenase subunit B
MSSKAKVLIIDFFGLEGFSANEIVKNLSSAWPQLSARRISFPEMETGAQVFPEVMARALEVRSTREIFALRLKEVAGDAEYIAMPAILGIHKPDIIHLEMEQLTGLPIFEIPTIPPAVPGIRLRELFERQLAARGATFISQQKVKQVLLQEETINLTLKDNFGPIEIKTDKLLIASGRFLSGGLQADQHQVRESLLDLPVQQPGERDNWFNESYFDPAGHAINQSGLRVTDEFQPINEQGKVIDRRLYCAGILLANQDWVRQRCGAGLAIATAYKAINAMTST